MAKYGQKSQKSVKAAVKKFKEGKLKSGGTLKPVKSREQAIAIGLSEAREQGAKVPPAPKKAVKRKKTTVAAKKKTTTIKRKTTTKAKKKTTATKKKATTAKRKTTKKRSAK